MILNAQQSTVRPLIIWHHVGRQWSWLRQRLEQRERCRASVINNLQSVATSHTDRSLRTGSSSSSQSPTPTMSEVDAPTNDCQMPMDAYWLEMFFRTLRSGWAIMIGSLQLPVQKQNRSVAVGGRRQGVQSRVQPPHVEQGRNDQMPQRRSNARSLAHRIAEELPRVRTGGAGSRQFIHRVSQVAEPVQSRDRHRLRRRSGRMPTPQGQTGRVRRRTGEVSQVDHRHRDDADVDSGRDTAIRDDRQ